MRHPECLPGGLFENGRNRRDFAFRPLDGHVEMALAEATVGVRGLPEAVTRALVATLESVGGAPATADRVDALCLADRQFLMRELQIRGGGGSVWMSASCAACAERFDFQVDLAAMPVRAAGEGFPYAAVAWGGRRWRARLPTGADQRWLVAESGAHPQPVVYRLLERLLCADGDDEDGAVPTDDDLLRCVDDALDAMAPYVISQLAAPCVECGAVNAVPVDSYGVLDAGAQALLDDVHAVAGHYHWSEADILRLPSHRRRAYAERVAAQTRPH
jgi:hypothetical protein